MVERIADAACGDLLELATSCRHTWEHFGPALTRTAAICSQCIDRRFGGSGGVPLQANMTPGLDAYARSISSDRAGGRPGEASFEAHV